MQTEKEIKLPEYNGKIPLEQRLGYERDVLFKIVQEFSNIRTVKEGVKVSGDKRIKTIDKLVLKTRKTLAALKTRRKQYSPESCEDQCDEAAKILKVYLDIENPLFIFERIGRRMWVASIDGFESKFEPRQGISTKEALGFLRGEITKKITHFSLSYIKERELRHNYYLKSYDINRPYIDKIKP